MPRVAGCHRVRFVAILVVGVFTSVARADEFRDIGIGLAYAGFNIEGYENRLSGGADFRISRNFIGNPLDFGAWDMTFQGPISLEMSTGGRLVPQLDIDLTTALTSRSTAVPLSYEFNYDVVGQSVRIPGTLLIDAGFSLDRLGFYDLELTCSSRQEISREGRFADDTGTSDFDIGPINISGNIYADALALITQPIFNKTGHANPFASLSGTSSFSDLLTTSADAAQKSLASGDNPVAQDQSTLLATVPLDGRFQGRSDVLDLRVSPAAVDGVGGGAVPEPTVLLLMLLALPTVIRRRPRPQSDVHLT